MGLLTEGDPLDWYEIKSVLDHVKNHGILQFINVYKRLKDRQDNCFKWGDEIEYMIVKFDHANKKVRLSLRAEEILNRLMSEKEEDPKKNEVLWSPEYAEYMLEGTPGQPYNGYLDCFKEVEENMRRRRLHASKFLSPDEVIMTVSNFPRLGCPDFTSPSFTPTPNDGILHSLYFPDEVIHSGHPRFVNMSRNVRQRRGENTVINVPIFQDENTPKPFVEDYQPLGDDGRAKSAAKPDHIYMDTIGFGTGCCCLQVTFQAVNINEARWLYDQLTPLTPVLLALSASTPIFRGYLSDVDSRWNIISDAVDDRTLEERGLQPLKDNKFVIAKSRYDTTDCYLCSCNSAYNDIPVQYDEKHMDLLKQGGVDEHLAQHVAHLFIRDPLQVYRERIVQDDKNCNEHFETIQSSNWMNMRFKPPPLDTDEIGWRVEFRPIEIQSTDFENAAYACFVVLLTRIVVSFGLTFLIPISKVNENMLRAQKRDAVLTEKFYFRRNLIDTDKENEEEKSCSGTDNKKETPDSSNDYCEMTINEIMNGKSPDFPGLISLIHKFLDSADVDIDTRYTIEKYLKFIQCRSNGTISTTAHWIRKFVTEHPSYKKDSVVSDDICYDLLKLVNDINQGRAHSHSLLGNFRKESNSTSSDVPDA